MGQDFFDPEILADFIIESKEHLETIEPNLLSLEKDPSDLSLLNEIFRPMHSLKGASGFLNFTKMNGLAHRAENILDELRKGTIPVNSKIMDVILASTDALRQMIDNLEQTNSEGDIDTQPLIDDIDAIMNESFAGDGASPAVEAAPPAESASSDDELATGADESAESSSDQERTVGDTDTWIEGLASKPAYSLTAFGEGHLRDFVEEAKENTSLLTTSLLDLESSEDHTQQVNDLFRNFHNLKGNSGIIGYHDLNGLTHEAETLLNSVRKDEFAVTSPLIDILLLTVDVIEALVFRIDLPSGTVTPFDTSELLTKLQQVIAGGPIELPESLLSLNKSSSGTSGNADASSGAGEKVLTDGDFEVFDETVVQSMETIDSALKGMREDGSNKEFADAMFRSLSNVQNACNFMGFEEIKGYAQRTAVIVDKGRDGGLDFSMMADLLEQECAIIRDLIALKVEEVKASAGKITNPGMAKGSAKLGKDKEAKAATESAPKQEAPKQEAPKEPVSQSAEAPKAAAAPAAAKPAAKPAGKPDEPHAKAASSTIRVDHAKLDHLMNLIGELIINRNRYSMLARQLESIDNSSGVAKIAQDLTETTYSMARLSDDLQATIMKVRMVSVTSVFSRFPRLVRDLARKSNKEISLIMEGEDTELDKSVVEEIGDPLVHLIRNSVDHGIESEEDRVAAGKPAKGNVWLRAYYKGNTVIIEVEDDGKGIDPEKMREVGIRKGVISAEDAKNLDDREAMELIFAPGFSSAEVITDISGRGVGMDVVRTNIKNLKGNITINSEVGKGSKFTLSLPLTLAIIDALMVEVDNEVFAIPLDVVSETTKIEASRLTDVKGRKAVTLRGEVLGLESLATILGLPAPAEDSELLSVVVIQDNDRQLGLVVDRMLERQEIVIKPLGDYLGNIQGISGATIMGDGSVILILEPHEIYTIATSKVGS